MFADKQGTVLDKHSFLRLLWGLQVQLFRDVVRTQTVFLAAELAFHLNVFPLLEHLLDLIDGPNTDRAKATNATAGKQSMQRQAQK